MATGPTRKRANLRDVAKSAGVSVATVSRVLNTPEKVSQATRDRVLSAIDALRFVPSAAARAINSGRTRTVGALIPTLDNAIFARFLVGLEGRLADFGLSLVVASTDNDPEIETIKARELVNIGAEGLIVSGITHTPDFHKLIERASLPTIVTSCFDPDFHIPTVGYDNRSAATIALTHLFDLGHRNIAVVHGASGNNDRTRLRIKTVVDMALPVELDFFEVGIAVGEGCKAVNRILGTGKSYSAILCFSDVLAGGVLFELLRQGVVVPDDISVMGMEDLASSEFTYPSLTTVHLPVLEMGVQAAVSLGDWLETDVMAEPRELPAELVRRQSTACPPMAHTKRQ